MKRDLISRFARSRARAMRLEPTSAEQRLWKALRSLPLEGTHFRRQVPIGPYIADIACLRARLVIEVDGPSHTTDAGRRHDTARDCFLTSEGYRVLRFWNNDVFQNEDGVLETIRLAAVERLAAHHPTPPLCGDPPPQRGGLSERDR